MFIAVTDSLLLELNNKFYKEAMKILILSSTLDLKDDYK